LAFHLTDIILHFHHIISAQLHARSPALNVNPSTVV
jgi:hypothetical protein